MDKAVWSFSSTINKKVKNQKLVPAKDSVSIPWQVVFMFIAPLNIWAFYRIKKLTKAAIYVFIPSTQSNSDLL